jgi:hypothetical protein
MFLITDGKVRISKMVPGIGEEDNSVYLDAVRRYTNTTLCQFSYTESRHHQNSLLKTTQIAHQ